MEADYWMQRWREGRTGWHQERPTPLMCRHWPKLGIERGSRVFVPLAGRSQDMAWFASQGLRVLGVELSELAITGFFVGHGLTPKTTVSRYGTHHEAAGIELICGDAFALDAEALAGCDAAFDRAAMIALPPSLRERYVDTVYGCLPRRCRGLLITLEYPKDEKAGPPFAVDEAEVRARLAPWGEVETLERRDILAGQPSFQAEGVTRLETVVYRVERRAGL
ncbi:thiopurine S-methyltransferase [Cognatilysobacter bugurensis]|uniref:Thiopurine S-methyltransferase n=1 Tax=Cognatilysobacter bugurensis TaxID=543356 RepID=A0A918SZN3_9GAMM|nr:thiopurine S-methyltransferase [Lysobacter bugurensis]GHA75356.1 thiopurine S-methyltransferase [Lysobacter bugurensis]